MCWPDFAAVSVFKRRCVGWALGGVSSFRDVEWGALHCLDPDESRTLSSLRGILSVPALCIYPTLTGLQWSPLIGSMDNGFSLPNHLICSGSRTE